MSDLTAPFVPAFTLTGRTLRLSRRNIELSASP